MLSDSTLEASKDGTMLNGGRGKEETATALALRAKPSGDSEPDQSSDDLGPNLGDDQLTVRFLSEQLARKCVTSDGSTALGWPLTLDEETSPKLSAYAVAAIGYSRLSRWMAPRNLPSDLREEDLRTYIIPREVEYSRFDPIERQAQIGFLDLRQALRVGQEIFSHSYFEEVGLSFDQRDENQYLFPDWYPQEDANQRNVERAVRISNVTSFDMDRTIRAGSVNLRRAERTMLSSTAFT
ncbi:hypothetical protein EV421DRAFT_1908722 [Armillaria borealis]|uniref:Uncharacterized protein n=1 Tax=Armillaria borealis TaxID=47425 RepID=A0AA39MIT2_9AGAR|nr:hypothetical protein EV421DRAFT_1908722 [Armillaria borealis]